MSQKSGNSFRKIEEEKKRFDRHIDDIELKAS